MSKGLEVLGKLSDEGLVERVGELVALERRTTANLVVLLAEVAGRELHLRDGSPSLFEWCRTRWGFAEDKAYNYVKAVELVRRWPEMGAMLADGRLSLSGMRVIGPHVDGGNVGERLAEAAGKSKRELAELVAKWSPRPDVPARVVRLPPPPRGGEVGAAKRVESAGTTELSLERPRPKHRVEPLSEARYRVQVTVGARVAAKLEEAMAIAGHQVAAGDYETLLELALDVFLAAKKKQRFGVGARPKARKAVVKAPQSVGQAGESVEQAGESVGQAGESAGQAGESVEQAGESVEQAGESVEHDGESVGQAGESVERAGASAGQAGGRGRAIPVAIRRAVVARDGLRCSFVGPGGRCGETRRLELHHVEAFARGGAHSVENLRVVCQAHNQFVAREELGAGFVAGKVVARG